MKKLAAVLVLIGLWPAPAPAQSPELMAAYKRSKTLEAQGKYAEAEPFARKALELGKAEYGPNHRNYSNFLKNLEHFPIILGHSLS